MTADNVRAFRLTTEQPQPASVPYSIFQHVCDERDRLRAEVAALNTECEQLAAAAIEPLEDQPTPAELERGEALIEQAVRWVRQNAPEEVMRDEWVRAFRFPCIAALYCWPDGYRAGSEDDARYGERAARGWWTPGRVAVLVTLLAVVAIVIAGR